ncbi:MAG TPA: hypothetical protein ENN29_00025, partial [Candidatus Hydrogenedentes bacterium]|nr:hypothetical protein [Candidatus Hydrogenedentota bacterium]
LMGDVPWRVPAAGVIAETYGQTSLAFDAYLPPTAAVAGAVKLRRQEPPPFYAEAVLHRDGAGGVYLGERQLEAAIPLPLVVKHLNLHRETVQARPFPIEAEGLLQARYEQNASQAPYLLTLDATDCAVRLQPWLHKTPGISLHASVQGDERGRTVDLLLDRQRITMYDGGAGNYQARDVDVALDKLARLFPQEITPGGNVLLSFGTAPLYMRAQLRGAEVTFAPDIRFGLVDGVVEYGEGALQLRDITVRGGGFDCRLNMTRGAAAWDAILDGARVDVNRLRDINEALARLRGHESPRETGITMPNATGTLGMRLGEVAYRRGAIRQVTGTAQISPEIIIIEDFSCHIGRGTAGGRVRVQSEQAGRSPATGGPRRPAVIYANLRIDGADASQAEQLLFEQPRDLAGRAWGTIEAQLPTGKEGYRRMDGKFQLQLRDGSLGKLGFATRLTSMLRNMEIVRLRMPSLQNEGLTYDNASINIVMRDGLAQLNDCTATSPSYTVEAAGLVDFGRMHTDVQVRMSLFDAVTGLMEHVPIIGPTATTALREATRIRLRATGPPFDIRWQPDILP